MFISEEILLALYTDHRDWPSAERLRGRILTIAFTLDDGLLDDVGLMLPAMKRTLDRVERRGRIVTPEQMAYLRAELAAQEERYQGAMVLRLQLAE